MKGGYQIVDFKENNLTSTPVTVPGIYESIEGNYYKPIMLSGIVIDGVEKSSAYVPAMTEGGNYTFAVYGGTITITAENAVTFTTNS